MAVFGKSCNRIKNKCALRISHLYKLSEIPKIQQNANTKYASKS